MLEIANPPLHLRDSITPVGQRHDHVVVCLSQRGTVARIARRARPVTLQNRLVHPRSLLLQPRKKRRAKVKADFLVIVDDPHDAVVRIQNSCRGVRRVAFSRHPLVPVVVGIGGILELHRFKPGVLPWWLVKMTVNANVVHSFSAHDRLKAQNDLAGNVSSTSP